MKELTLYTLIKTLVNNLDDEGLTRMIDKAQPIIDHMIKTNIYKTIERDVRRGVLRFDDILEKKECPDKHLMLWLSGLVSATESFNVDHMLVQTNTYIAAQRANVYRIEDDKMRLVVMYVHLRIFRYLISEEENP